VRKRGWEKGELEKGERPAMMKRGREGDVSPR